MSTLVVGPFYLSGALGLGTVQTGLVMSVGPDIAVLTGAPARRLIDGLGSVRVIVAELVAQSGPYWRSIRDGGDLCRGTGGV